MTINNNTVSLNAERVRRGLQSFSSEEGRYAKGGGGGNDGMDVIKYRLESLEKRFDRLDVRLDKVDVRLDKIDERHDRDFRVIFGALIAVALGLAGLMAKGFHWL
ncbi:MAG: hypothetical protein ABF636_11435 [Acetobacter sp.]|jgi:hypothetical protein|uniref:Uncharacterized protein n=1 Tax=Acetobacter lovaniensis TaxID=104100 RepID=A0A841QG45_9PROT|nr:hypothetical protein [Acetobacter lovaniensis]MBB6457426.1 hypothetical protein [Acetobacter lovaniensis]MCP1240381.1 hypothetical protein [Acetobacter lovaniensis]NHN81724.1 hypothetical protein [Acetobacter lovaniensis]GBQ70780.1 hypothetical protein AA0474_2272 [Acetobacter lovaniensis NRIC 0474]